MLCVLMGHQELTISRNKDILINFIFNLKEEGGVMGGISTKLYSLVIAGHFRNWVVRFNISKESTWQVGPFQQMHETILKIGRGFS